MSPTARSPRILAALAAVLLAGGCSAAGEPAANPGPGTGATAAPGSGADATDPLVGTWSRTTMCEERVQALQDAGLGQFAAEHAAGEGWIPGVSSVDQLPDPSHPCQVAVPVDHEHFFTAAGGFGCRDATGPRSTTARTSSRRRRRWSSTRSSGTSPFRFTVSGNTLTLVPELPACAAEGCFAAQWAVAVSYSGLPWRRVS